MSSEIRGVNMAEAKGREKGTAVVQNGSKVAGEA
jgi:hypothetical protein